MFNFEEELKKLPHSPGVYLMHDAGDTIIYVGKAVNLHSRVRSYFRRMFLKSCLFILYTLKFISNLFK